MLITITDIAKIRPITQNMSDLNSLEPYIQEAEQVELKSLLGTEFYYSLVKIWAAYQVKLSQATIQVPYVPTTEEVLYIDLMNGAEYKNLRGYDVSFSGLITVLSYFSYARFIINDNLKHTNAGLVFKRTEYSDQPSAKAINDKMQDAKSMALSYWEGCHDFLFIKSKDYPIWLALLGYRKSVKSGYRISGVTNRHQNEIHKDRYVRRDHL